MNEKEPQLVKSHLTNTRWRVNCSGFSESYPSGEVIDKSKLVHLSKKKTCGDMLTPSAVPYFTQCSISCIWGRSSAIFAAMNNMKFCWNPCSPLYERTPGKCYFELETKHKIVGNIILKCPHLRGQSNSGKAELLTVFSQNEKGPVAACLLVVAEGRHRHWGL